MNKAQSFDLPKWINSNTDGTTLNLSGSAPPGLSLEELTCLSSDPQATARAFDLSKLQLGGSNQPVEKQLKERIAALYDKKSSGVTADDVMVGNSTTGSNLIAFEALLSPGDHMVCLYPCYAPLFNIPKALGVQVSYWKLPYEQQWQADLGDLKSLLKPTTKMIVLNNPNNPTGYILPAQLQKDIIAIAAERGIIVFCDEIFRPLYDTSSQDIHTSLQDHGLYDKVVVTGSLSKAWGLMGVRIGWIVTRSSDIKKALSDVRLYTLMSVSRFDEVVASEALSDRCKGAIMSKHLSAARQNLDAFGALVGKHKDRLFWTRPTGGGTAFVRFIDPKDTRPVDDLQLGHKLKNEAGVLVSPGVCFCDSDREGDFPGFMRVHTTMPPDQFAQGVKLLDAYLEGEKLKG